MAETKDAGGKRPGALARYARESRDLGTSFLFALPLLLLYEIGVIWTGTNVVNGASAAIRALLAACAPRGWGLATFNALVVLAVFAALVRTWDRGKPAWRPGLYFAMACESAVYAVLLLVILGWLPHLLRLAVLTGGDPMRPTSTEGLVLGIVLSLGAGVYEEIFFRLGLLGGCAWFLRSGFGVREGRATGVALLLSAFLFALFHHLGSMGETFALAPMVVRTAAGCFLGQLYLSRGLGLAIGAHALYDVIVVTLRHATAGG